MTKRFILTGAPGAGKTSVAQRLGELGHDTVAEAATRLIADQQTRDIDAPWEAPDFIDAVAAMQREQEAVSSRGALRFSDRALFCTLALAEFLGRSVDAALTAEADALAQSGWFDRRVFYLEQLDFIVNTPARRISLEDARRFGDVHRRVYRRFGFTLIPVSAGPVEDRAGAILLEVARG